MEVRASIQLFNASTASLNAMSVAASPGAASRLAARVATRHIPLSFAAVRPIQLAPSPAIALSPCAHPARATRMLLPSRKPSGALRLQRVRSLAAQAVGQEVEVKLRLPDSAAYDAVAAALEPSWKQDHQQENFFFDGSKQELNSQRAVLRCRFYGVDKRAVLTLKGKMKITDGVGRATEVEEDVDPIAARSFLTDPSLLANLDSKLMNDCRETFGFGALVCLGGFSNLRREYEWEGHLLELDKTEFEHGTMYEIEVETATPEQMRDKLQTFLSGKGISFAQGTTSKFANFIKKTLE